MKFDGCVVCHNCIWTHAQVRDWHIFLTQSCVHAWNWLADVWFWWCRHCTRCSSLMQVQALECCGAPSKVSWIQFRFQRLVYVIDPLSTAVAKWCILELYFFSELSFLKDDRELVKGFTTNLQRGMFSGGPRWFNRLANCWNPAFAGDVAMLPLNLSLNKTTKLFASSAGFECWLKGLFKPMCSKPIHRKLWWPVLTGTV